MSKLIAFLILLIFSFSSLAYANVETSPANDLSVYETSGSLKLTSSALEPVELLSDTVAFEIVISTPSSFKKESDKTVRLFDGAYNSLEKVLKDQEANIEIMRIGKIERGHNYFVTIAEAVEPRPRIYLTNFTQTIHIKFTNESSGVKNYSENLTMEMNQSINDFLESTNTLDLWGLEFASQVIKIPQYKTFHRLKAPVLKFYYELNENQKAQYGKEYKTTLSEITERLVTKCRDSSAKNECRIGDADLEVDDELLFDDGKYLIKMTVNATFKR